MLAKYYSVYLIAGFVIATFMHRDRWVYLKSSSPWVSTLAGFLLLAPHIHWLATTGFQPFDFALREHTGSSVGQAFWKAALYAIQGIAYVVLPVAAFWLATRPRFRTLVMSLRSPQADLRMLAVLLWAPLILPFVTAPLMGAELTPLWTMQGWFLLPILLLAPSDVLLSRTAAIRVGSGLLIATVALLLVAPAIALLRHHSSDTSLLRVEQYRGTEQAVARRLTAIWHQATGRPLTIVAGWWNLPPYAVTFYSPDHPDSVVAYPHTVPGFDLSKSPWVTTDRLRREGWLAVCPARDDECLTRTRHFAAGRQLKLIDFEIVTTFWRQSREPASYIALLAPPIDEI
jgi:hypothetical protein